MVTLVCPRCAGPCTFGEKVGTFACPLCGLVSGSKTYLTNAGAQVRATAPRAEPVVLHEREREGTVIVAALVAKAGGEITLTDRDILDAFDLTLETTIDPFTGGRSYRASRKPKIRLQESEEQEGNTK